MNSTPRSFTLILNDTLDMAKTYSLGIYVVRLAASQFHGGVVGADVAADVDGVGVDDGLGEERGLEAFVGVDGGFGGHG